MLNIPGHKGNANQNYVKIPLTPIRLSKRAEQVLPESKGFGVVRRWPKQRIHVSKCRNNKILKNKKEHKQQVLVRMWGKKEPSYTAGGNVN
jgi:hypothetical protein